MTTHLAGYRTRTSQIAQIEGLMEDNPILAENYQAAAAALLSLRMEDNGWAPINRLEKEDGFDLAALKDIANHAEFQSEGNPLLKRGFTLRRDNVWGRGVSFQGTKLSERIQTIVDKPVNQKVLFTEGAYEKNERSAFIAGNLLMAYRISTETFFPLILSEISNYASNPDLKTDVYYYQRTYTKINESTNQPEPEPTVEWYPVLERWEERSKRPLLKSIANSPVVDDIVVIDFKVNTSSEHVWGVPDCLPAMPYAWAHAEYIRDASKLLKALSTIAWKVVAKSKGNTVNAAAKMAAPKQQGSTALMTEGTDLVSMPKAGQVDMTDGNTIAAYVASALEVSLVALLSDPSAASGSYGAAATLDGPSANSARARQKLWEDFYKRVFRVLGAPKGVTVNFPKIQEDPIYRTAQTLQIGMAYGAIHADEFRAAYLEATDVVPLHPIDEIPEPSPFSAAAQFSAEALAKEEEAAQREADSALAAANVQGQGVSKPNGTALGSDNTNRDASRKPGTSK